MKKVLYSLAVLTFTLAITSCNKDNLPDMDNESNIETRATSLGFADVDAYEASVSEQHAAGNHENCDILSDGTHKACTFSDHSGTNHDGTAHNGTDHGTHDENGHSHDGQDHGNGNGNGQAHSNGQDHGGENHNNG